MLRQLAAGLGLCMLACAAHYPRSVHFARNTSNLANGVAGAQRCQSTDPACGQMPSSDQPLEQSLYVAAWPRVAPGGDDASFTYEAGACAHDGECYDPGCGYSCLSTRDVQATWAWCISEPVITASMRGQFCGCVSGRCRWFGQ
jgi:hypothetical protein